MGARPPSLRVCTFDVQRRRLTKRRRRISYPPTPWAFIQSTGTFATWSKHALAQYWNYFLQSLCLRCAPRLMLKVLLFPFYIIRAIWSLLPILAELLYALINGFVSLAQALKEGSEKAEKASRELLEEERERRLARAKEVARLQRELDECPPVVHPEITRSKTQTVARTSLIRNVPQRGSPYELVTH